MGTKSLLVGGHQFLLHPAFVAVAWRRLYGRWPGERGVWLAIVAHDWGYWGLPNMDGPEGQNHPIGGARLVARWLARDNPAAYRYWYWFTASHSRSYAGRVFQDNCSKLMRADKLATHLYPRWLYVALLTLSGEWREYKALWIAAGTYPGRADDGPWAYAGHLQEHWGRFRDRDALAGNAYDRK